MSVLSDFIIQYNIQSLDDFDNIINLPYVTEKWTYSGVAETFGPQAAEGLSSAMEALGLKTAIITYATVGFDLSLDETRAQLDALALAVPAIGPVCQALKAIGRPTIQFKDKLGYKPTQEEWDAAQQELQIKRDEQDIINKLVNLRNSVLNMYNLGIAYDKNDIDNIIQQLNALK